jgi:4-hydroxy-2-oxoheptanedioate aldolase
MTNSRALQKLHSGGFVRIINVSRVSDPWLVELAGWTGFDVIWLDMEHRNFDYGMIDPMSLACRATSIDLMVRVLKTGYSAPMRALEFGANGLMIPHVRSVAEAREWVEWTRFPPLGKRGFDGAGVDASYSLAEPVEYMCHANRETFLLLQIEDKEALDCVEEIAAVEGVDMLFIGTCDLSISLGVPMQTEHTIVRKAIERCARAAENAGKWWGLPTENSRIAQEMLDMGARLITCGSDHGFLVQGVRNAFEEFSSLRIGSQEPVMHLRS